MKKDGSWRAYFADPARYADAINGFGCKGEQIVSAEDLQEVDTQLGGFRLPGFVNHISKRKAWNKSKFRDMVRKVAFGVNFAIVGIESQETIDYSIPLRNMIYDVAEYEKQAVKIRRNVRKNAEGLSVGEYLYGFCRDSRLYPVMTFILYSGVEEWQGPTCLHDILDFTDIPISLKKWIPNYKINVISIRKIKDTSVFKTDLRYVLDFMRYAENKKKLKELIENTPYYQNMEEDAYDVVANYANVPGLAEKKEYYREEEREKMNLCTGLKEWMEDERAEGKAEGMIIGIVKMARRYRATDDEIVEQLVEELSISKEKAKEYLKNVK